jgi:hypothetical protein
MWEAIGRVRRIRVKSLGQILALQEEVARRRLAAREAARPVAVAVPLPDRPPA